MMRHASCKKTRRAREEGEKKNAKRPRSSSHVSYRLASEPLVFISVCRLKLRWVLKRVEVMNIALSRGRMMLGII